MSGIILPTAAADLDHAVAEAVPTWTGFHIGIGGAYGAALHEGSSAVDGDVDFGGGATAFSLVDDFDDLGDTGGLLTVEAGFDFRLGERFVLGILGDYTRTNFDSSSDAVSCVTNEFCVGSFTGVELENLSTVAGRFGFLSSEQTLWYGLVGWTHAGGQARTWVLIGEDTDFVNPLDVSAGQDDGIDGITIGAGVESMLTEALSLKLEYRYTDFGGPGDISRGDASASIDTNFDTAVHTIRGVLSWRFDLSCKFHPCARDSRSGDAPSDLSIGPKTQLPSGCAKVHRAPKQYSRETVEICEIARSL